MKDYVEIVKIQKKGGYKLLFYFNDSSKRLIDFSEFLNKSVGVFSIIKNKNEFTKFKIDMAGGISWECGADLCAEALIDKNRFN
ncbi:MAG: DUF2442 domain-containing protein [Pseudomonadota bacterium]